MTVIGQAYVEVLPKTDGFASETEKGVTGGLGSIAKKAAVVFGGALALGAGVEFVKKFVEAGAAANAVNRVTAAIVQSTGGAANVTAEQVGKLGDKLAELSGVAPETVKAADNILLSFRNIKDAAGTGNDIFDQTAKAALDMSTVMGTDVSSAALQLGKALNDPTAGLSKLTRAGVTFTDAQKEQIKQLQAAGDTLGAQKIILKEVETEFGGAAEAAADPFKRLSVAMDELKVGIGQALIPAIAPAAVAIANLVSDHTTQIADGVSAGLRGIGAAALFLLPGIRNVAGAFKDMYDVIAPLVDAGKHLIDDVLSQIPGHMDGIAGSSAGASTAIAGVATGLLGLKVGDEVVKTAKPAADALGDLTKILGPLLGILGSLGGAILAVFGAPVLLVAAVVAAIGAAAFLAYEHFKPFADLVDAAGAFFVDTGKKIADFVTNLDFAGALDSVEATLSNLKDDVSNVFGALPGIVGAAGDKITSALQPVIQFLTEVWAKYGDQVTGILVGFRDIAVAIFDDVVQAMKTTGEAAGFLGGIFLDVLGPAFSALAAIVESAIGPIEDVVGGVIQAVEIIFETFIAVVGPAWSTLWSLVVDVVSNVVGPISDLIEGVLTVIQGVVDIIAGIFTLDWTRIWTGVQEIVSGAVETIEASLGIVLGFLAAVWSNAADLITLPFREAQAILSGLLDLIKLAISTGLQAALDFVSNIWAHVTSALSGPVSSARDNISGIVDDIIGFFAGLPGRAASALDSLGSSIGGAIATAASDATTAATNLVSDVVGEIEKLPGQIISVLGGVAGDITTAVTNTLKQGVNDAIDFINNHLPSLDVGPVHIGVPKLPRLASGGIVPGAAGQATPAIVHGGEVVLNPAQQATLARALFDVAAGRSTISNGNGGSGDITIDARLIVESGATVTELSTLAAMQDAQAEAIGRIVQTVRR